MSSFLYREKSLPYIRGYLLDSFFKNINKIKNFLAKDIKPTKKLKNDNNNKVSGISHRIIVAGQG